VIRALRDYFTSDIDEVVVDSDDAFDRANEYMHLVMPKHKRALSRYVERRPIFHHYRIEDQLDVLYAMKVPLKSGGSIVIEQTEALVAVDVNSGKQKESRHEETAVATNLEAAAEVARQLRLRDLGGIVVIDFIDMFARKNERKVVRALREAFLQDKARIKIGQISPNGTLELTRQRLRSALEASVFRSCPVCKGTGHILNPESHAVAVLRRLRDRAARGDLLSATVKLEPEAANHLRTVKWTDVQELMRRYNVKIDIISESRFLPGQDDFAFMADPNAKVEELPEPNFGPPEGYDVTEGDGEEDLFAEPSLAPHDEDDEEAESTEPEEPSDIDDDDDSLEDEDEERMESQERSRDDRPQGGRDSGRDGDRSRRRRRGRRGEGMGGGRPSHGRDDDQTFNSLALPSFEMMDLDAYRQKFGPVKKETTPGGDDRQRDEGGEGGRRRRRGRGRGRGGEGHERQQMQQGPQGHGQQQQRRGAPQPQQTKAPVSSGARPAAQPAKTGGLMGFFKKLFGG